MRRTGVADDDRVRRGQHVGEPCEIGSAAEIHHGGPGRAGDAGGQRPLGRPAGDDDSPSILDEPVDEPTVQVSRPGACGDGRPRMDDDIAAGDCRRAAALDL
jgi:hypothetical protein